MIFKLIAVSAVVMGLSHTIAREKLFAPLRDRLGGKETWRGYLFSCPYCLSHYLAFVLVPVTGLYPIQVAVQWGWANRVIEWFLASILVTVVAAFMRVIFWFVDEAQALERGQKKRAQEEAQTASIVRRRIERGEERAPH